MVDNPFSIGFVFGCLVWVPVCVWVCSLVSWMIAGEVEWYIGFIGICIAIAMGAVSLISRDERLAPYMFVAALSVVILGPKVRDATVKHQLAQADIDSLERAYEQLSGKPDNVGAKLRVAKVLYSRGAFEQAVATAESALKGLPATLFDAEHKMIRDWKARCRHGWDATVHCIDCGTRNNPGEVFCVKCGSPILLYYAKGSWVGRNVARRLIGIWVACIASLVGVPIASSLLQQPYRMIVGILIIAASGWIVWFVLRPEGTAKAS
jgi:hypothetical protein